MALNPLSNPKGVKLNCELCAKPAFTLCSKCRVTYYCSSEHQSIDWIGIHEKICQLLIPLRTAIPFTSGSEEERASQREQQILKQKQMIVLTRNAGQKLLFEEKYEYAIPAAMQSLKFSIEVFGITSIELVPSYLSLGKACIGLGRLSQAEEYLSQAQWTILKTPECKDELKSCLYRNLGMLYATQKNLDKALENLAEDVYYASCAFGTDDIRTSGGYFHMANIFQQQNKLDVAYSLYSTLTSIWHDHLINLVKQRIIDPQQFTGVGPAQIVQTTKDENGLNETQGAEAVQILHAILSVYEKQSMASSTEETLGKLYFTLTMLYMVLENGRLSKEFFLKSSIYMNKKKTCEDGNVIDTIKLKKTIDKLK